jgi:ATP-dependent Lon protease
MEYGIDPTFFDKNELHIHIPEGAIPKDGPSAGMAMALALISLITDRKIRHDVAMTGELTLRGEVLPIGGLNEKLLAAQRNKIKTVLIPEENMPNLEEIPDKVKEGLTIEPVKHIKDAEKFVFE